MNRNPKIVRIYQLAIRFLLGSLGQPYVEEATETFRQLYEETDGTRARLTLVGREAWSLLETALWHRRGATIGPHPEEHTPVRSRFRAFVEGLGRDLGHSWHRLRRSPGFTFVSVSSLSIGMVVAIGLFTIVNTLFLRPMPHVDSPQELRNLEVSYGAYVAHSMTYWEYEDLAEYAGVAKGVAASSTARIHFGLPASSGRTVYAGRVSPNFFDVLGVPILLGRGFLPSERVSDSKVVVISEHLWTQDLGGIPGVVGQTVELAGTPHQVVGVVPSGVESLQFPARVDLWTLAPASWSNHAISSGVTATARIAEDISDKQLKARLKAAASGLANDKPGVWRGRNGQPRYLGAKPVKQLFFEQAGGFQTMAPLVVLVVVILLVPCSNVAGLLVNRSLGRRRESALRLAIGATRTQLVRQMLTESVLLTALSGALGLCVVLWVTASLGELLPFSPEYLHLDFAPDLSVLLFSLGLVLVTGLGFGLLPSLQASRTALTPALKEESFGRRARRLRPRNIVVSLQVAGSLTLLATSGLLLQSFYGSRNAERAYESEHVAVLDISLSPRYEKADALRFHDNLRAELLSLPGVERVSLSQSVMMEGAGNCGSQVEGYGEESFRLPCGVVSPDYFRLMEIPLLRGREFTAADREGTPNVLIVNRALAERFWTIDGALGKRVSGAEIVGIVADNPFDVLTPEAVPQMWFAYPQFHVSSMTLLVKSRGDIEPLLDDIRAAVEQLDPVLSSEMPQRLTERISGLAEPLRMVSGLLGAVGVIALLMASLGIFSLVSYLVNQRRREVGVRMVLGATGRVVVGHILRHGVGLFVWGAGTGLTLVVGFSQVAKFIVPGLGKLDMLSLLGPTIVLFMTTMLAAFAPAWRASRIDPATVLRSE